jgi:hypothetical protein
MRGHVIAIGVLNFVFAAGLLLCGIGFFVAGGMVMSALGGATDAAKAEFNKAADKAIDDAVAQGAKAEDVEAFKKTADAAGGIAGMLAMFGTAVVSICGIGGLVFGLLYLFAGLGCVKFKGYGRVLTLILSFLQLIFLVLSLVGGNIVGIVIGGLHVYFLVIMFNGATGQLFREGGQPAHVEA